MAFIFNRISRSNENPNPDSRLEDGITNYLSLDFNNVYAYQITYVSTAINKFDARIDRYDIDYVNETLVYKDSVYASNYIDNSTAVAVDPAQSLLAAQLRGQQINTGTQRTPSQDGFIWRDPSTEIFAKNDCGCEDSENGGNLPPEGAVKWNDILFRPQCLVNPDLCSLPMWSITQADINLWNSAWSRNGNSITNTDFFGTTNNEDIRIRRNNTPIAIVQGTGFNPAVDNTFSLGTNALRWSNVFGAIGTFNSIALPTFTQGSVLFAGAGGVISQDFAGIAFDAATNRLALNRAYIANTTFGLNGQGATSATWTAQFHNSTGTSNSLMINDNGDVFVGRNNNPLSITNTFTVGRNSIDLTPVLGADAILRISPINNTFNSDISLGSSPSNAWIIRTNGVSNTLTFRSPTGIGIALQISTDNRGIWTTTRTAIGASDWGVNYRGTLTARNVASDVLNGVLINPLFVAAANNQILAALNISATFNIGAFTGVQTYALYSLSPENSYFAGNVGVGSTTINARVHIRGNSSVTGNALLVENSTPTAILTLQNDRASIFNGSVRKPQRTVTTTTTMDVTDHSVFADATTGNITINLPTAVGIAGVIYAVKKIDSSVNTVTIDPSGAQTIDGAATLVLATQYDSVMFQSNGANWFIIN